MPDRGKKVLILGNGFDLAHGLPTKYEHFLDFVLYVRLLYTYEESGHGGSYKDNLQKWDGHKYIKDNLLNASQKHSEEII